jgi:hypothetical protein
MDSRISSASRPDVVTIEGTQRPTPTPARVSFGQVLAASASGLVQGAELVAGALPGSPLVAGAIRGAPSVMSLPVAGVGGASVNTTAEGPGGASASAGAGLGVSIGGSGLNVSPAGISVGGAGDPTGGIDASLQQSAQLSMYYLQVQQQVDAQNRSFTALSNVLKTEHDSAKAAIANIHS